MKCLITLVIALCLVTPAMAGENPYIAVVGNDAAANPFYNSQKYQQFMYDQSLWWEPPVCYGDFPDAYNVANHPVYGVGCEQFRSQFPVNQPEVCNATSAQGNLNAVVSHRAGWFEWYVRLTREPSGEINLVLQCGVLKPGGLNFTCAGETGEKIGSGTCTRQPTNAGSNPVTIGALPKITAIAYPGPYNVFTTPFHLTAFRNPGTYTLVFDPATYAMADGPAGQVLDGTNGTRILLKSCMDKTIVVKLPVTGQLNSLGETENDLMEGDMIYVRMEIPSANTVDIYCHEQSLKVMGIGETLF